MSQLDGELMEFTLIQPKYLRHEWQQAKRSFAVVREMYPTNWIDEDVYYSLKTGFSAMHFAHEEGKFLGLLVTNIQEDEFSGEKTLHVWIAHNRGEQDVIESGLDMLRMMATAAGAKSITFGSPRKGWIKKHKLLMATYEIEL